MFVRSNFPKILRKITQTNQKEEAQNRDCYRYSNTNVKQKLEHVDRKRAFPRFADRASQYICLSN